MAELFKGIDRNPGVTPRGFYITSMKKDPQTGHYVGVVTWIAGNQPMPGTRVYPKSPIPDIIPEGHQENSKVSVDVERQHAQVEDSRSEFNQHVEKFKTERRPRSGFFDPYDSYDM